MACIASSESCEPKRFIQCWNKVERGYILSTEWTRTWPSKNGGGPRFFECILQGVWVLFCINKDKGDESLPLLAFRRDGIKAIFLIY